MNSQIEVSTSVSDVVKQVVSFLLMVSGIAAFYYYSDIQLLYRVLALLIVSALTAGIFFTTELGHRIWSFVLDSKQEVRKVVWPTREETVRTTLLVFAMVIVVGLLLGVLDKVLFEAVRVLTGQRG